MDQNQLIALAIEGDSSAIKELYDKYKNDVFFLCHKLMGTGKDAANVLQYTFFQAFHRLNALKVHEEFETWLYVIASNKCKSTLKENNPLHFKVEDDKNKGDKKHKVKFYYNNDAVESENTENEKVRAFISSAIDKMTDPVRIAIMMYFYGQINLAQTAKILQVDDAAVKEYINKGVHQLEKEISDNVLKVSGLDKYKSINELYTLLHREAKDCVIAPELDEAIVSTSSTLVMATRSVAPTVGDENTNNENVGENNAPDADASAERSIPAESDTNTDASASTGMTPETKNAIRNLALVVAILVLAIGIITASVIAIKKLADSNFIKSNEDTKVNETQGETDPDTEITDTETEDATDAPVTAEPVTEPVTEAPETTPPETEPVTPPSDGLALSAAEASKLYKYDTKAGEVVIDKYTGKDLELVIPSYIDGKKVTYIDSGAFEKNATLQKVTIPGTVEEIGEGAFQSCTSLKKVVLEEGVKKLDTYTFRKCTALTDIEIPSTVCECGLTVFGDTPWYKSQTNEFVIVGDGVLVRYTGKTKDVVVPDTVKYISNAFYFNGAIKTVTLPASVKSVGRFAFYTCGKLESVTLTSSITNIDKEAFVDNSALKTIIAPADSYAAKTMSARGFKVSAK